MDYKSIVTAPEAVKGFYPTPKKVADVLLEGIDWNKVETILEPSAGKGDLVYHILAAIQDDRGRWKDAVAVDTVEIDPSLRDACVGRFSETLRNELENRKRVLEERRRVQLVRQSTPDYCPEEPPFTEADRAELKDISRHLDILDKGEVYMVADDFLTFRTAKSYDLIVMNPPFSDGAAHLEKAIAMQKNYGGQIRCVLNAETFRNPYSLQRQALVRELNELGATIRYMEDGFVDAERSTDVEVAIISIDIPAPTFKSDIFERMQKAAEAEERPETGEGTDLALDDMLARTVSMFNVEVNAGLELIRTHWAMEPHMNTSFDTESYGHDNPILELTLSGHKRFTVNKYLRAVRCKYWRELFRNPEFSGKMTSDMRKMWNEKIAEMANYDFSLFNIKKVVAEINCQLLQGVEDAIEKCFEKLTSKYSWYPECQENIHYFNGWRTNVAHYVNKKVILPCGAYARDDIWKRDKFNMDAACDILLDIEKVLDFFNGEGVGATVDMRKVFLEIEDSLRRDIAAPPKNLYLKHFTVSFFKKGTVHITFHNQELLDRFNIYCARGKSWLPPNYGRTAYSSLDDEERAVVDSFNGDDTPGSGEKAYTEVYENQDRYLVAPGTSAMSLPGSATKN